MGLAQGSPLLALDYANDGTLTLRNDCFKAWMDIAKQRRHPVIIAEDWHKLPESPLIFWITSWIIDIIKCCYQIKADWLYNPDLERIFARVVATTGIKRALQIVRFIADKSATTQYPNK